MTHWNKSFSAGKFVQYRGCTPLPLGFDRQTSPCWDDLSVFGVCDLFGRPASCEWKPFWLWKRDSPQSRWGIQPCPSRLLATLPAIFQTSKAGWRICLMARRVETRVDQIEANGMALVAGASRFWLNWPLLGLSDVKTTATSASLRWRVHCIDPESKPGDYHGGMQNSNCLRAFKGRRIVPDTMTLRTGVLELECQIETWHDLALIVSIHIFSLFLVWTYFHTLAIFSWSLRRYEGGHKAHIQ